MAIASDCKSDTQVVNIEGSTPSSRIIACEDKQQSHLPVICLHSSVTSWGLSSMVEHSAVNRRVTGSNPVAPGKQKRKVVKIMRFIKYSKTKT